MRSEIWNGEQDRCGLSFECLQHKSENKQLKQKRKKCDTLVAEAKQNQEHGEMINIPKYQKSMTFKVIPEKNWLRCIHKNRAGSEIKWSSEILQPLLRLRYVSRIKKPKNGVQKQERWALKP